MKQDIDSLPDMAEAKEWSYVKNHDWRPSMGGCLDPLTALKNLMGFVEGSPLDDQAKEPDAYAALFHAKEAVAAWRQKITLVTKVPNMK